MQYVAKKIVYSLQKRFPSISRWYTEHFPAVRLGQDMDAWEYSINFSSELLVGLLVLVVAGLNVFVFNPVKAEYTHNDKSLAARLLAHHSSLNNQLAVKQNTVSTTIASNNGFISQAFADNEPRVLGASTTIDSEPTEDGIDDNGITKANPDSIRKMVGNSVKIIKTKPFDTVYTVAKEYNVSPKTIRETNGLPDNALKAGWDIVVPPVDGLVIQVTNSNLTLSDVAHAYSADINQMVSYNGLEDAEDMVEVGEYLIVPHGTLPAPKPTATPTTPTPKATGKTAKPSIPKAVSIAGNHRFASGYCTDYVARNVAGVTWGGNAKDWPGNARAQGILVDMRPAAGAVLVTNENRRYGHVAKIDKVEGNTIYFSEWNYAGLYKTTHRTMQIGDGRIKAIIHP